MYSNILFLHFNVTTNSSLIYKGTNLKEIKPNQDRKYSMHYKTTGDIKILLMKIVALLIMMDASLILYNLEHG